MTVFEQELQKLFGEDEVLSDVRIVGMRVTAGWMGMCGSRYGSHWERAPECMTG